MHHKQRGITFIGWLFLLVPIAIVGYAAIRLIPVYLNYTKVVRVLEQVDDTVDSSSSVPVIRLALENRLYVEGVNFPTANDIAIRRNGQKWVVQAKYEDEAPMFANISLRVLFDKSVEVQ